MASVSLPSSFRDPKLNLFSARRVETVSNCVSPSRLLAHPTYDDAEAGAKYQEAYGPPSLGGRSGLGEHRIVAHNTPHHDHDAPEPTNGAPQILSLRLVERKTSGYSREFLYLISAKGQLRLKWLRTHAI